MQNDYYVGFDLGTSSIGWAVTDTAYKTIHEKSSFCNLMNTSYRKQQSCQTYQAFFPFFSSLF